MENGVQSIRTSVLHAVYVEHAILSEIKMPRMEWASDLKTVTDESMPIPGHRTKPKKRPKTKW